MSDLLTRLDVPMPPYADEDGYYTVPVWVIELAAKAAARIRELEAQLADAREERDRMAAQLVPALGSKVELDED
jgi:hypothetical protein